MEAGISLFPAVQWNCISSTNPVLSSSISTVSNNIVMCTYIFLLIRDVTIYLFYYASSNIELIVAVPTAVVHAARAVRNFLSIALQGLGQGDTLFRCLIVRVFALLLRACTTPMLRRQAVQSVQLTSNSSQCSTTVVSFYPGSCIKVVPLQCLPIPGQAV